MKAVRLWSLLAVLFFTFSNTVHAGDSPSKALLIAQLKTKVLDLVHSPKLKSIDCDPQEVRIDFKIDRLGEIVVTKTSTSHDELDTYIKDRLDGVYHHRALAGKKFVIKVAFKKKSL